MSAPGASGRHARRLGTPALVAAILLTLWTGGLLWFAAAIPDKIADPDSKTDAIVVLTGGSLRIKSGLELLAQGKARKLFISGVYPATDAAALLHAEHLSSAHLDCCIVLGHSADNTLGNAIETASWMRREGFHSLRLVTGAYHMPRSLLEFRRAMPDIRIIPHPVFPERVRQDRWWVWPGTAALIVGEYNKYLVALARPVSGGAEGGAPS